MDALVESAGLYQSVLTPLLERQNAVVTGLDEKEEMESLECQSWYDNAMCGSLSMDGAGIAGSQIKLEDR